MSRGVRRLLLAAAALAALCGIALAGLLLSIDRQALTDLLAQQARAATGRTLAFARPLGLELLPAPALVAEGLSLANAPWGSRPEMLRVRRLELRLALLPLLRGRVEVARLRVAGLDLLLETDAEGRANWVFEGAGDAAAPAGKALEIELHHARIEDARIALRSARIAGEPRIELGTLTLAPAADGLLSLQAQGSAHGRRFDLGGRVGRIGGLLRGEEPYPVDLAARLPGATLALKGALGRPAGHGMDLRLSAEVQDLAAAGALLGQQWPGAAFSVSARLREAARVMSLDELELSAPAGRITGRLAMPAWGRPRIEGELAAGTLDLRRGPAAAGAKRAADGRLFSAAPLPLELLRAADARLALRAERLVLPNGGALDDLSAQLALEDGRLTAEPIAFAAGGGRAEARFSAAAGPKGAPQFSLSMKGRRLGAGALAGRAEGIRGGATDVDLRLAGRGGSLREIMASLDGHARVVVGEARVSSQAMDYMGKVLSPALDALNPARRTDPDTHLLCAVLRLPVKGGVVQIDDSVGFETDRLGVLAAGSVDLRSERIDLAARPSVKKGIDLGAGKVAQAVKLGGTLAEPALTVNPLGVATAGATVASAIATGGLSLLGQALFARAFPDEPCKTALGSDGEAKRAAGKRQAGGESGGGLFGSIKRLFGQ